MTTSPVKGKEYRVSFKQIAGASLGIALAAQSFQFVNALSQPHLERGKPSSHSKDDSIKKEQRSKRARGGTKIEAQTIVSSNSSKIPLKTDRSISSIKVKKGNHSPVYSS